LGLTARNSSAQRQAQLTMQQNALCYETLDKFVCSEIQSDIFLSFFDAIYTVTKIDISAQ